jgi:hypothetical protein
MSCSEAACPPASALHHTRDVFLHGFCRNEPKVRRKSVVYSFRGLLDWPCRPQGRLDSEGPTSFDVFVNETLAFCCDRAANRPRDRAIAADDLRATVVDVEAVNAE